MIALERHIEILLLDNDCVIIPDFGGFVAHHADARYDEREQLFIPPLRTLGFNPQLRFNDSLLAQSYTEAYDISYPEALRRIQAETQELKDRLDNEGRYEMNDLGTLSLNADGNIEFAPCEAGILTPAYYAFSTFEMSPLSAANVGPKETIVTVTAETTGNRTAAESHRTSTKLQPTTGTEKITLPTTTLHTSTTTGGSTELADGESTNIRTSLLRNLAAACIAIVAFLLLPSPLQKAADKPAAQAGIDTRLLYRVMPQNVTTGSNNIKQLLAEGHPHRPKTPVEDRETSRPASPKAYAVASNSRPTPTTSQTATPKAQAASTTEGYCIVLASNVSRAGAEAFIGQLTQQGIDNCRIREGKHFARVTCGLYPTEQEALQARQHLSRRAGLKDCWIMKVKGE